MIEPVELTIYDWVKVDQTTETVTARVLGVHKDGVINYEVDYSGVRATDIIHADYVSPIGLTEDILVKNGWFALDEYRYEGDIALAKESSGFRLKNTNVCVNSVHELQHLLRLCGIEKELVID